jgi:transcription elongation GreA/GreB family factor
MTTTDSPDDLRAELNALDERIAELQRIADDARHDLADTSDKTAAIEGAEQQEALISQLEVRRRDLVDRLDEG